MQVGVRSYRTGGLGEVFTRSAAYRALCVSGRGVREPAPRRAAFSHSERHVQCVWYDPAFRPRRLFTQEGERIAIEDPGIWNLEAGPDFLGAVVRAGPHRRRLKGDVEVHVHASGWRQHGHVDDPRYRGVRFHVTWFPGTLPEDLFSPGTLQVSLRDAALSEPTFSLDAIDVTAYPYATRARVPPCSEVLSGWDADAKCAMLDAAGEERLRRKANRVADRIDAVGRAQGLYEEVMAALGYKHNRWSFRVLAHRVPLDELRAAAGGDVWTAYAILMGVAGLLPDQLGTRWDRATRAFVRRLWDTWWKVRAQWESRAMGREMWQMSGCRPPNRPDRRMMAAARLFASAERLEEQFDLRDWPVGSQGLESLRVPFMRLLDTYWDRRLSLGGRVQDQSIALLGPSRVNAVLVDVVVPYLAAIRSDVGIPAELLDALPCSDTHHILRQTAHWLFGPDHPASLYRSGLRRQGLTQIFHDFCLQDRSRCAHCTFPGALRAFRAERVESRAASDR